MKVGIVMSNRTTVKIISNTLIIFLLVPEKATQEHLEILSAIAQLLSDAQVREQLLTEPDPQKVQQLICHWEA